jgi:peptide/nickel transport system substrate-binding protein
MKKSAMMAATFAGLSVVVGCGTGSECSGDWCGTLIVAQGADAETLFPPTAIGVNTIAITDLIFLRLADLSPELNTVGDEGFVPQLATSWSRLDSLTLRFSLDDRATWHDGEPVTARDVAFTFAVYTDTLIGAPLAARLDKIADVIPVDDRNVEFRFKTAYSEQFFDAVYHMRILPAHVLDSIPLADLTAHPTSRNPVGTGPYTVHQWLPDQFLEFRADTTFFLGRPGMRRIIWQVTPDKESALAQVLTEQADVIENLRNPQNISQAAAAPQLNIVEYPTSSYMYLQFNVRDPDDNTRPHRLFRDRTLRRALSMAVDRETALRAVFGDHGEVSVAPVTRTLSLWSPDLPRLDYDRSRAIALLEGLGWNDNDGDGIRERNGEALSFELLINFADANRRNAAIIIQDQMRQVGVDVQLPELEFNSLIQRVLGGNFDMFFGFDSQDPTPTSIRGTWGTAGIGGSNFGGYSNSRFDNLMDQAIATFDPAASRGLWYQALEEMVADAPAIWLFSPASIMAVHRRIENVTVRPDQWASTMWTWSVPETRMIARDKAGN